MNPIPQCFQKISPGNHLRTYGTDKGDAICPPPIINGGGIIKKVHLSAQFQYMTLQPNPKGQGCVKSMFELACWSTFLFFNLICKITAFRKKKIFDLLTPSQGSRVRVRTDVCFHGALCSILFNFICNITTFRKKNGLTY